MGSAILHGVLNMPIDVWGDDYVDKVQRAARYIEASELIDKLESENADLRAQLAEACKDSERLDWIISQSEVIVVGANTSEINYVDAYFIDATVKKLAYGNNPREAIDNAMKGGE